MFENLHIPIN